MDLEIFKKELELQLPILRKKIEEHSHSLFLSNKESVYNSFKTEFPILWYYINDNTECKNFFKEALEQTVFYLTDSEGELHGLKLVI